jgi:hypothetical protein
MAEGLRPLVGPYELLDLPDRGSVRLRIVSWEQGSMTISPRYEGAPSEKVVPVLRVHLAAGVKPYAPYYYDITSKTLQAQLVPLLLERGYDRYEYVVTKYGVAPRARFTLERVPLGA